MAQPDPENGLNLMFGPNNYAISLIVTAVLAVVTVRKLKEGDLRDGGLLLLATLLTGHVAYQLVTGDQWPLSVYLVWFAVLVCLAGIVVGFVVMKGTLRDKLVTSIVVTTLGLAFVVFAFQLTNGQWPDWEQLPQLLKEDG